MERYAMKPSEEEKSLTGKEKAKPLKEEAESGNEDHLTYEEIMSFINTEELSDESKALVNKVLSHIINCPLCREELSKVQNARDLIENIRFSTRSILFWMLVKACRQYGYKDEVIGWIAEGLGFEEPVNIYRHNNLYLQKVDSKAKAFAAMKYRLKDTSYEDKQLGYKIDEKGLFLKEKGNIKDCLAVLFQLPGNPKDTLKVIRIDKLQEQYHYPADIFEEGKDYLLIIESR